MEVTFIADTENEKEIRVNVRKTPYGVHVRVIAHGGDDLASTWIDWRVSE